MKCVCLSILGHVEDIRGADFCLIWYFTFRH